MVPANAVLAPLRGLRELVDRLPRGFRNDAERIRARNSIRKWLKNSSNVPPLGLEHNLAEAVADAIVNTARWVVNPVADAMRDSVLDLLDFIPSDVSQRLLVELYTTRASDPDPVRFAKAVFREGFTIVERGASWPGITSGSGLKGTSRPVTGLTTPAHAAEAPTATSPSRTCPWTSAWPPIASTATR